MREGNWASMKIPLLTQLERVIKYGSGQTAALARREGVESLWAAAGRFGWPILPDMAFFLDCDIQFTAF
jgi:hypothetical protein